MSGAKDYESEGTILYRLNDQDKKLEELKKDQGQGFKDLNKRFDDLIEKNDGKFVSKEEFSPIKALVYGVVALVLTAFFVSLIALATHWGK